MDHIQNRKAKAGKAIANKLKSRLLDRMFFESEMSR
jgi:hypothetical protein